MQNLLSSLRLCSLALHGPVTITTTISVATAAAAKKVHLLYRRLPGTEKTWAETTSSNIGTAK